MANYTYEWSVQQLKVSDSGSLQNVVIQTYWGLKATDENGNFGVFNGATPFNINQVNSGSFIPFEQLTEETIISWIKEQVYSVRYVKDNIDRVIDKQIREKTNQVRTATLPWLSGSI